MVYAFAYVSVCGYASAKAHVQRSVQLERALDLHCENPEDGTQVIRLSIKHLFPLSHLTGLIFLMYGLYYLYIFCFTKSAFIKCMIVYDTLCMIHSVWAAWGGDWAVFLLRVLSCFPFVSLRGQEVKNLASLHYPVELLGCAVRTALLLEHSAHYKGMLSLVF